MANEEHLDILGKGVAAWNRWRAEHPNVQPDLERANLAILGQANSSAGGGPANRNLDWTSRTNFSSIDLSGANLRGVNLERADLCTAQLTRADIMKGNLAGAILIKADLTDCNLRGVHFDAAVFGETSLRRTNLMEACFRPSNLHSNLKGSGVSNGILRADFEGCAMLRTILVDMDLSVANGLETVNHGGPSHIGIDTIYRSQGKIPEVFLRGAGVPENLIEYMRSLAVQSFEFYSSFISHSSKDRDFAERLYTDLQAKGVRCWYFPEDAGWGEPVWGEIDRAIKIYDKLVVICSADSLQSGPVIREIERSLQREDSEKYSLSHPD